MVRGVMRRVNQRAMERLAAQLATDGTVGATAG